MQEKTLLPQPFLPSDNLMFLSETEIVLYYLLYFAILKSSSFVDNLCYLCLVFVMLSRLFIAALWSPERKGLTSWFLFVLCIVIFYFPIWYPGTGVVIDCIDS